MYNFSSLQLAFPLLAAACLATQPADAPAPVANIVQLAPPAYSLPRITPAAVNAVSIGGSFWGPRIAAVRAGTLAANRHQCDSTGRIANFENAAKKIKNEPAVAGDQPAEFQGLLFNDSDVYKMMEGWAYLIATESDPIVKGQLDKDLDALIAKVAAAQYPDGYINTYYTLKVGVDKRFSNDINDHETYCLGHLIEAGVAHFECTGKRTLLDVAIKAADLLEDVYAPGKLSTPSGHQEIELALVRLADATSQFKYRNLASAFIEMRGRPHRTLDGQTIAPWGDYAQDHKPAAEQTEAAGHAVRAGYMYAAMTDLAARGEPKYTPALQALWHDITQRRIFVTGGIGPSGHNEGFTVPFDIPVTSAYQETCASIALCQWAQRMFILEPDARYMEQFEKTLYNAVLAGVSLDGSKFFYVNPMASRGGHARSDWFACACCPPNVLRFFASLGRNIYAVGGEASDTVYVNLFIESKATLMSAGKAVEIEQKTDYPYGGQMTISVRNTGDKRITLAIRQTSAMLAQAATSRMGAIGPAAGADGYRRLPVNPGQTLSNTFKIPLPIRRVYSDPRVKASFGRAAIMRGPLVYAVEAADNTALEGAEATSVNMQRLILPASAQIREGEIVDGVPVLTATGSVVSAAAGGDDNESESLYRTGQVLSPETITMRPYFMWANREPGQAMNVWLAETPQVIAPQPRAGITATASYTGNGEGLVAMFDRVVPESAADGTIPRFTFWPKKGGENDGKDTGQWVRYDFTNPRKLSEVSIWWFDDTGVGQCRLPKAFELQFLAADGKTWSPVSDPTGGAIALNAPSVLRFSAIETRALRLNITLPDGMSTGILEWTVGK